MRGARERGVGTRRRRSGGQSGPIGSSVLARAVARWKASEYSGSGNLLDLSGNGHHLTPTNVTWLDYTGTKYAWFPGTVGNNLSLPNPAASSDYTITYHDDTTEVVTAVVVTPILFGENDIRFVDKKIKSIEVRNTADQVITARFLASGCAEPYASFVDSFARTWTFNRTASGKKLALVDRDMFLLGTNAYFETPDHANLDFAAADSFTVAVAARRYGTAPADEVVLAKHASGVGSRGFMLDYRSTGLLRFIVIDGAATPFDQTAASVGSGLAVVLSGVRSVASDNLQAFIDSASDGASVDTTTASLAGTDVLRVGRRSGADTLYGSFEFVGAAIWREALSTSDITALQAEFGVNV